MSPVLSEAQRLRRRLSSRYAGEFSDILKMNDRQVRGRGADVRQRVGKGRFHRALWTPSLSATTTSSKESCLSNNHLNLWVMSSTDTPCREIHFNFLSPTEDKRYREFLLSLLNNGPSSPTDSFLESEKFKVVNVRERMSKDLGHDESAVKVCVSLCVLSHVLAISL